MRELASRMSDVGTGARQHLRTNHRHGSSSHRKRSSSSLRCESCASSDGGSRASHEVMRGCHPSCEGSM